VGGGVAGRRVGAATVVGRQEGKDRVDYAGRATRAAFEEGILPGGGTALIRALNALKDFNAVTEEEAFGVRILRRALEEPLRQISHNAGVDGSIVVGKVSESDNFNLGYNAATDSYEDLVEAGVIDPAKVTRTALQNAASIAGLLLTTEALIVEKKANANDEDDFGGMNDDY